MLTYPEVKCPKLTVYQIVVLLLCPILILRIPCHVDEMYSEVSTFSFSISVNVLVFIGSTSLIQTDHEFLKSLRLYCRKFSRTMDFRRIRTMEFRMIRTILVQQLLSVSLHMYQPLSL